MQRAKASQPRDFKFPSGFCITQNPQHWSNEKETLSLIEEVIAPYIAKKRVELKPDADQKSLLIWDVFRGQVTDKVKKLMDLNIEYVYVPANMTLLPALGPNGEWMCKAKDEEGIYYVLFQCCKATT